MILLCAELFIHTKNLYWESPQTLIQSSCSFSLLPSFGILSRLFPQSLKTQPIFIANANLKTFYIERSAVTALLLKESLAC